MLKLVFACPDAFKLTFALDKRKYCEIHSKGTDLCPLNPNRDECCSNKFYQESIVKPSQMAFSCSGKKLNGVFTGFSNFPLLRYF
jgi:hypothetical protein